MVAGNFVNGMNERRRSPSIEDVALEAGVSVATVSRALRGLPNVAASTKERVQAVADEMGYRADPSAARLATGRTNLVQIATPTVDGWYFSRFLAGAIEHLNANGYEAIAHPLEDPSSRDDFLNDIGQVEKRVDGLILVDLNISEETATELFAAGVRVVTAGFTTAHFPSVLVDDYRVGYLATEHLLELGHSRIGLISGQPNHPLAFSVPGLRLAGFTGALGAAGMKVDPELEQSGRFTAEGGRLAMERLLRLEDPPTAVFAMSDEMAFGAIRAVQDRRMRMPDDVAIVGVDDHEIAAMAGLTTVRLYPRELGALAAESLLSSISSDSGSQAVSAPEPPHLVVRRSTVDPID